MIGENGCRRNRMGATPIHFSPIFNVSQWGSSPESFIQKYWLVSNLPIFQNYYFFNKFLKFSIFFIFGVNFIGLYNVISFVFILSVVVDTQKEMSQLYCRKISIDHHCKTTNVCLQNYAASYASFEAKTIGIFFVLLLVMYWIGNR